MPGSRMLFSCRPLAGHYEPLVPLAAAAKAAGHEVAFATGEPWVDRAREAGFEAFRAGRGEDFRAEWTPRFPGFERLVGDEQRRFFLTEIFANLELVPRADELERVDRRMGASGRRPRGGRAGRPTRQCGAGDPLRRRELRVADPAFSAARDRRGGRSPLAGPGPRTGSARRSVSPSVCGHLPAVTAEPRDRRRRCGAGHASRRRRDAHRRAAGVARSSRWDADRLPDDGNDLEPRRRHVPSR